MAIREGRGGFLREGVDVYESSFRTNVNHQKTGYDTLYETLLGNGKSFPISKEAILQLDYQKLHKGRTFANYGYVKSKSSIRPSTSLRSSGALA